MAFLFNRNKTRGDKELCRNTRELLEKLATNNPKSKPALQEEITKPLSQMKQLLQGTHETPSTPDQQHQLITALLTEDVLPALAPNIHHLPFESRKDAHLIFSSVLRFRPPGWTDPLALNYIATQHPEIIPQLCHGYDHLESAMQCGAIIKEALKLDAVAALILYDEPLSPGQKTDLRLIDSSAPSSGNGIFWRFFTWIDTSAFEVSANAFETFAELVTKQKKLASCFIQVNMALFVEKFNNVLIQSTSYVTKRQSLQLLSQLLLERSNYTFMTKYIESPSNLKLIMLQLKDDRRMVNYEAFHAFKIFVANPNKSAGIQRILINNREKLLKFLPGFLEDRGEDDQFMEEKAYLVKMIRELPSQPVGGAEEANGVDGGGKQTNGVVR